ncbi:MAG: hypothetical protein NWR72_19915, partial [Bacteroidia bacterium]|nr:hypothetical protein [Bacteroidia bacterium]
MKRFSILALLFPLTFCFSQDYLPIQPGRTYFFGMNDIVKIDSVKETVPGYETQYAAPGVKLCFQTATDLEHFSFRDSVFLHKKKEAELWVFPPSIAPYQIPYQLKAGDTAFCTTLGDVQLLWESEGVKEETFLGQTDSVRTLRMICLDSSGVFIPNHYLQGEKLRISKTHGALNWFAVSDFYSASALPPQPDIYDLTGISHPNIGLPGYSRKDIYDFYPGDEVH